jgi:hypothetical protein
MYGISEGQGSCKMFHFFLLCNIRFRYFFPGTHWIGGWVDLRAGLDDLEKRKFLTLPGLELTIPRSMYQKNVGD